MHTKTDEDYTRGYEWWLMKEAKKVHGVLWYQSLGGIVVAVVVTASGDDDKFLRLFAEKP